MAEENKYTPSVTTAEIANWEKRFKEAVSPLTQFDNEEGKPSMKLYDGTSGVEASWSGIILLKSDSYIKWSFSIQNSPFVEAKFALDADAKKVMDGLYDFYTIWRDEWSKSLSIPPSSQGGSELPAQGPAPTLAAPTEPAPGSAAPAPITEAYIKGANRTKENIIESQSDRMRKLAGLI